MSTIKLNEIFLHYERKNIMMKTVSFLYEVYLNHNRSEFELVVKKIRKENIVKILKIIKETEDREFFTETYKVIGFENFPEHFKYFCLMNKFEDVNFIIDYCFHHKYLDIINHAIEKKNQGKILLKYYAEKKDSVENFSYILMLFLSIQQDKTFCNSTLLECLLCSVTKENYEISNFILIHSEYKKLLSLDDFEFIKSSIDFLIIKNNSDSLNIFSMILKNKNIHLSNHITKLFFDFLIKNNIVNFIIGVLNDEYYLNLIREIVSYDNILYKDTVEHEIFSLYSK